MAENPKQRADRLRREAQERLRAAPKAPPASIMPETGKVNPSFEPPPHPAVGAVKATGRKASTMFKDSPGWRGYGHSANYFGDRTGMKVKDIPPPIPDPTVPLTPEQLAAETPEQKRMRAFGYDYESIRNTDGTLKTGYSMAGGDPWVSARTAAEDINRGVLLDQATSQGLGQRLSSETALGARGGIMGGSRERLMRGAGRDISANRQGVRLQSELNKLGIMSKGADLDRDAQIFNIDNLVGDVSSGNLGREKRVDQLLEKHAAEIMSRAIARG